jgi:hypothetical protein
MQVVYTVPLRLHPILAWILRVCTWLLCIGAVVFTVVGLIRNQRHIHPSAHPMQHVHPIIVPYK